MCQYWRCSIWFCGDYFSSPSNSFQEANLEPSIQSLRRTRDLDPGGTWSDITGIYYLQTPVYISGYPQIYIPTKLVQGSTLRLTSRLGVGSLYLHIGTSARSMDTAKAPPLLVMVFKTKRFAMRLGLGLTKPLGGKLFGKRT